MGVAHNVGHRKSQMLELEEPHNKLSTLKSTTHKSARNMSIAREVGGGTKPMIAPKTKTKSRCTDGTTDDS